MNYVKDMRGQSTQTTVINNSLLSSRFVSRVFKNPTTVLHAVTHLLYILHFDSQSNLKAYHERFNFPMF